MITTLLPFVYPGMIVKLRGQSKLYKVSTMPASNAKRVKVQDENGLAYSLPLMAVEESKETFKLKVEDIASKLFLGTKVRLKNHGDTRVMVVCAKTSSGNIRVAVLGGDGDRYYTPTPAQLVLVED